MFYNLDEPVKSVYEVIHPSVPDYSGPNLIITTPAISSFSKTNYFRVTKEKQMIMILKSQYSLQ